MRRCAALSLRPPAQSRPSYARQARHEVGGSARAGTAAPPRRSASRRAGTRRPAQLRVCAGRRGVSSEGAAAASAAARRRGAASRKATLQARAPEEDTPRRPRAEMLIDAGGRALLARRPGHRPPAEQMEVQMIDVLTAVLTRVDHRPVPGFRDLLLPRDRCGERHHLAQ